MPDAGRIVTAVLILNGALAATGHGQTFACGEATAGQLSLQATVQCACRWFTADARAGTPAGYRWDCGILRARANHTVPVDLNPYPYPLPDALGLDRIVIRPGRTPLPHSR